MAYSLPVSHRAAVARAASPAAVGGFVTALPAGHAHFLGKLGAAKLTEAAARARHSA
jgi:hypothetical protein